MQSLPQKPEIVEKIILETRIGVWVALSVGGCGILARAKVGRHDEEYRESRSIALAFAHRVVHTIGLSRPQSRVPTPQILIDAADEVISDAELTALLCTTWQYVSDTIEICSVGSNSVLVFEGNTIEEVVTAHTINELLRSQGAQGDTSIRGRIVTHTLGAKNSKQSCRIDDVRVAHIPLLPTTTIAIIEDRRLADAILNRAVPGNELFSFIESWKPQGTRIRTSVLLSL